MKVVTLVGSLREGSFNRRLAEAAAELAPAGMDVAIEEIRDLPLYDADLDDPARWPDAVRRLREEVETADAVLIATPEYNHTVPGVLQNAIDWVSRPGGRSPLADRPAAIMGASAGAVGTARAQQILKLTLLSTKALVMPHAGVAVGNAGTKFDGDGRLTDDSTRRFLASFMEDLESWVERFPASAVGAAVAA